MQQLKMSINVLGSTEADMIIDYLTLDNAKHIIEAFFNANKCVDGYKFIFDDFSKNGAASWYYYYNEDVLFSIADTSEDDTLENSIRSLRTNRLR